MNEISIIDIPNLSSPENRGLVLGESSPKHSSAKGQLEEKDKKDACVVSYSTVALNSF